MAALSAITPDRDGTTAAPGNVAASDTISVSIMGPVGCYLEIINGNASDDNMTISDATTTKSGAAAAANAPTVTAGTSKVFLILRDQAVTSTGLVTVTHSVTTTVTYKLFPV